MTDMHAIEAHFAGLVSDVFRQATFTDARDPHALTASGIGACLRQGAYRVAGIPISDDQSTRENRAAHLGTALHEWIMPRLAQLCSGRVVFEHDVTLSAAGLRVPGRLDLYTEGDEQGVRVADLDAACLVDVKSCGDWSFTRAKRRNVPYNHLAQSGGYATALVQEGKRIDHLVWIYIHRATGAVEVVAKPYGPLLGTDVIERVAAIVRASADPDSATREGPGPAKSLGRSFSVCDGCEWLSRCWPPGPGGAAPQARVVTDEGVAAAEVLDMYDSARVEEARAKDRKGLAKAMMSGSAPGVYGKWQYRLTRTGAMSVTPAHEGASE